MTLLEDGDDSYGFRMVSTVGKYVAGGKDVQYVAEGKAVRGRR